GSGDGDLSATPPRAGLSIGNAVRVSQAEFGIGRGARATARTLLPLVNGLGYSARAARHTPPAAHTPAWGSSWTRRPRRRSWRDWGSRARTPVRAPARGSTRVPTPSRRSVPPTNPRSPRFAPPPPPITRRWSPQRAAPSERGAWFPP